MKIKKWSFDLNREQEIERKKESKREEEGAFRKRNVVLSICISDKSKKKIKHLINSCPSLSFIYLLFNWFWFLNLQYFIVTDQLHLKERKVPKKKWKEEESFRKKKEKEENVFLWYNQQQYYHKKNI